MGWIFPQSSDRPGCCLLLMGFHSFPNSWILGPKCKADNSEQRNPLKGLWVNSLLTPLFPGGRGEVSFQLKNLQHSLAQVGSWQQLFAFLVLGRYKCDALNC